MSSTALSSSGKCDLQMDGTLTFHQSSVLGKGKKTHRTSHAEDTGVGPDLRALNNNVKKLARLSEEIEKMELERRAGMAVNFADMEKKYREFDARLDSVFRIRLNRMGGKLEEILPGKADKVFMEQIVIKVLLPYVIVKTPGLFNRNKHYAGPGCVDYYSFYAPIVKKKMQAMKEEFPEYSEKNISIVSVYSTEKSLLPDTDNLDSKLIIDAITQVFPGKDSATSCTFSMMSLWRDDIPEGAYFLVSPGFGYPPNHPEVLKLLTENAHEFDVLQIG